MTLEDLRNQTKAAWLAVIDDHKINSYHRPPFKDMNMRQSWADNYGFVAIMEQNWPGEKISPLRVKFRDIGRLYYYAKDHGIEAAMLWKLSGYPDES
jgi:hypothetical protein